ncbi:hypothetical protein Tco_1122886 [Tanacetum coccineum]|uniref:Uncharacterized protein n=1 Tax=Tanacetum coccineum TaxID=301880 RepID=A0ABQ5J2W8_9ASTR
MLCLIGFMIDVSYTTLKVKEGKDRGRQDVIPKEVRAAAPSNTVVPLPDITEDKGKAKMDEPEVPLKKKDQIALEEMARNLEAQIQTELIKEERLARKKKEANIALIES